MSDKIQARNLPAQLRHRATGNPEHTLPHTAISNCFPGLETDFRNFWRRAFVGLVLLECDNYVVAMEDTSLPDLTDHRLLQVGDQPIVTNVAGPQGPGFADKPLLGGTISSGVASMEWSNSLAAALQHQERVVRCYFTKDKAPAPEPLPLLPTGAFDPSQTLEVDLTVRKLFIGESAAFSLDLIQPGELSQGLCSPWQNDYRECACYYWAASRPDYVRLAMWGRRVCLVEKARFPRVHVGESLSPGLLPMLDSLGLASLVRSCAQPAGETWLAWEKPEPERLAGAGTLLADRAVLDTLLLQAAAALGVHVIQPARALPTRSEGGWSAALADHPAPPFRTRFIIDAAGRRGALPGRRVPFSPPLQALWSRWPGRPGDPVRVEAIERGWLWAAPVGPHSTSLLFFGNRTTLDPGAQPVESFVRETLAKTRLFQHEAGASLEGEIIRCDATCMYAREPLGPDFIKIGEACCSLDPLSSTGVEKAVQSALQGASIVQTLLEFPERYELCARFYRERQEEAVARHTLWNGRFYSQVERFAEKPFWAARRTATEPAMTPAREPRPLPAPTARLRLARGVSLGPEPCLAGPLIESRDGLRAPALDRPVVYFEGIEIAPLLRSFSSGSSGEQWMNQWAPQLTEARAERLAAWLWQHEILEPAVS